ncbi:MAG: PQQ-binding-like beta-propeller repeat protein [Planctomycetes bacterium]|nr:PQQ-binding-like beta-propeller repeat protein [Planctomycetota bacterium]
MALTGAFDRSFLAEIPLPLPRLYTRAHHAKGERERHDHALHLLEAGLKLAAAALVSRYRGSGERAEKVDATLRHLALPSLGQWRDIVRGTLGFLAGPPLADPWARRIAERLGAAREDGALVEIFGVLARAAAYAGRASARVTVLDLLDLLLPAYRNAMSGAHGSIKADPASYREAAPALLALAREMLEGSAILGGGRLVYAEDVKVGPRGEHQVVWMDLSGPTALRRQAPETAGDTAAVLPGRLYLEIGSGEHLPLHPLLYYQPGEVLDQVFFLNRARGGRSGIQFLSYETGEFYLPGRDRLGDLLVGDLEELLAWVTSRKIAEGELEELAERSRSDARAGGEAAEEEVPAEPAGTLLGDFEVLGELGRGGMAVVYLARQRSLGRLVALKVLPPTLQDDAVALGRFRQEVRALSRCDHPNVVKILSSGEAGGTCFYAMEHIDGGDLGAVVQALRRYRSGGVEFLRESHFDRAASAAARLEGHPTWVNALAFSPGSGLLASASDDGTVRLWDPVVRKETARLSGHLGPVRSVAFSPDGARLVSGSADGTLRLWDPGTGKELKSFQGHAAAVRSVAFSPDGARIASGSFDRTVRLWRASTGEELSRMEGHEAIVNAIAFSPDGRRIASAAFDGTIRLCELPGGREAARIRGHKSPILSLAFSPDGARLASGSRDSSVKLWAVEEGRLELSEFLLGHAGGVEALAFSGDGSQLFSGSIDGSLRIWDPGSGKAVGKVSGHGGDVVWLSFSPDGKRIASAGAGGDPTVRIWDAATGEEEARLEGHGKEVRCVVFSPDGKLLASGGFDRTIRLWDAETGRLAKRLVGHNDILSLSFSPDGRRLASGLRDREIRIWDVSSGKETGKLEGHTDNVRVVIFFPDGRRLASAGTDGTVCLWDLEAGKEIEKFTGHEGPIYALDLRCDGNLLASAGEDKAIRLWDLETGAAKRLEGHAAPVIALAFRPDGRLLASGSADGSIRIWDLEDLREVSRIEGHEAGIRCVAISPDGKFVASGGGDRTVRLWEFPEPSRAILSGYLRGIGSLAFHSRVNRVASGSGYDVVLWNLEDGRKQVLRRSGGDVALLEDGKVVSFTYSDGEVRVWDPNSGKELERVALEPSFRWKSGIAFSPDGTRAAKTDNGGQVLLWDLSSGKLAARLEGSSGRAGPVAFGPGGKLLAAAFNGDRTIVIWDIARLEEVRRLRGHSADVTSLAFSPEGKLLASGSLDATVRVWRVESGEAVPRLEHPIPVASVAFSPDGSLLASGCRDGAIRFWDPASGEELGRFEGHAGEVARLAFSRDGRRLASGGGDRTLRLWRGIDLLSEARGDRVAPVEQAAGFFLDGVSVRPALTNRFTWLSDPRSHEPLRKDIFRLSASAVEGLILDPPDPEQDRKVLERLRAPGGGEEAEGAALYLEGSLLQREGRHREAAEKLEKALAASRDPEIAARLSESLRKTGEAASAEGVLRKALEEGNLKPGHVWLLWAVSVIDLKRSPEEFLASLGGAVQDSLPEPLADLRWLLERLEKKAPVRINCGGGEFAGQDGAAWGRDRFFTGGSEAIWFAGEVAGTEDDLLYHSERYFPPEEASSAAYRIPLLPGRYRLTLHFAEVYFQEPGMRRFDVRVEGAKFLDDYDPRERVGFAAADRQSHDVDVTDGVLDIEFVPRVENPKVSAIEVRPVE